VAIEFANELALDLDGDRHYAFGMNTPNTVYTGPVFNYDWRGPGTSRNSTKRRSTRESS